MRYTLPDKLSDWHKLYDGDLQVRKFVKIPEVRLTPVGETTERYANAVELPNGALWFITLTEYVNDVHEATHGDSFVGATMVKLKLKGTDKC